MSTTDEKQIPMWLPTRPYTLIDAINRCALSTGSIRYAVAGSRADYNGHSVTVTFNNFRGYWTAEYFWAGRIVLARGEFADCLREAQSEYDRGAKAATVRAYPRNEEEVAIASGFGFVPYSEEIEKAHLATFQDARYEEIHLANRLEKQLGCPAVGFLANSTSLEDYRAKVDAFFEARRPKPRIA